MIRVRIELREREKEPRQIAGAPLCTTAARITNGCGLNQETIHWKSMQRDTCRHLYQAVTVPVQLLALQFGHPPPRFYASTQLKNSYPIRRALSCVLVQKLPLCRPRRWNTSSGFSVGGRNFSFVPVLGGDTCVYRAPRVRKSSPETMRWHHYVPP